MNLQYNKGLLDNTSKIFDIYLRPTHKTTETHVKVYTDAINGTDTEQIEVQDILFASESFVTILNKINTAFWNETFSLSTEGENVKILVNTILNGTESQRNSSLDKMVSMGIVTAADVAPTKSLASRLPTYNPALMVRSYNTEENFYKYSYDIPLGLEKKYDQVRNTNNEKLYLIFVGRGHSQFGYTPIAGETFGYFNTYWDELFQKNSYSLGFIAVDLGDLISPDEEAIKYDHLDVVEYFDDIHIQITVPNQYN